MKSSSTISALLISTVKMRCSQANEKIGVASDQQQGGTLHRTLSPSSFLAAALNGVPRLYVEALDNVLGTCDRRNG
ncbi:hypothetical protein [Cupriavidus sp. UME77]|jgi:hypothetical protein|uniref:hypothetical protein n=1 Tax=Cupriavidus sp. UME77 TaxID=1862321 RepID=UPI0015FED0E3|nr:hypothetical protein [Cupriavidus sp. UME77]